MADFHCSSCAAASCKSAVNTFSSDGAFVDAATRDARSPARSSASETAAPYDPPLPAFDSVATVGRTDSSDSGASESFATEA